MYERLDKLLKEKGITAYALAKATGISPMTLSDWKHGKYTPKADKMKKIADYFDVPIEYFLDDQEVSA